MITISVMPNFKGTAKETIKAIFTCLVLDMVITAGAVLI